MTAEGSNSDKFFDAIEESFKAITDAMRSGNERGYRFSKRLTNEVEQAQVELTHLARKFARDPRDVGGLSQSSVELARRAVTESAALSSEWVAGATEAGRDVRQTAAKVIQANRSAAMALAAAVQTAAQDLSQRAGATDGGTSDSTTA